MKRFTHLAFLLTLSLSLCAQTVSTGSGSYSGAAVRLTASCLQTYQAGASGPPLFGGVRNDACPSVIGAIPNLWTSFSSDAGYSGAGKCAANNFGLTVCRLTDGTTSTSAGNSQLNNYSGGDSDEHWGCGSYSAGVCTADNLIYWGGASQDLTYVALFNPANVIAGTSASPFTQFMASGSPYTIASKSVAASQTTPNIAYVLGTTTNCTTTGPCAIQKYDFTACVASPSSCSPTVTTLWDFAASGTVLNSCFNNTWNGVFRTSGDDSLFSFGMSNNQGAGGQGTGTLVLTYTSAGERIWNTGTSSVCGIAAGSVAGVAPTGVMTMAGCRYQTSPYTCNGTTGAGGGGADEFLIHDAQTWHNNNLVVISSDSCLAGTCTGTTPPTQNYDDPYVWEVSTLNSFSLGGGQVGGLSGEATYGYNAMVAGSTPKPNINLIPVFSGSAFAPYRQSFSVLSTSFLNGFVPNASPLTIHMTWGSGNSADTYPVLGTNTSFGASLSTTNNLPNNGCLIPATGFSGTPNCGTANPFTGPGVDEIMLYPTSTAPGSSSSANTCAVTNGTANSGQNGAPPCTSQAIGRLGNNGLSTVNPSFNAQNGTIDWSQSGNFYDVVTDWWCTLGTNPSGQTPICGGLAWAPSHVYHAGDVITPSSNNAPNCTFTASAGTSGATQPTTWASGSTCATTVTEASGTPITWTFVGKQNMRYDVIVGETGQAAYLSWTQATDPNVVTNNVYRGTQSGGPYTEIYESSAPITSYTDTPSAGTYYYVVTAVSNGGGPPWPQTDWSSSTAFFSRQVICPTVGNAGSYSFYSLASGTSGGTEPTWPQTAGATTSADGTISGWENGANVCTTESLMSNEASATTR